MGFINIRIHPVHGKFFGGVRNVKAFVSCKMETPLGNVFLNSMSIRTAPGGLYLDFPKRDGNKAGFEDFYYLDADAKVVLTDLVLEEYHKTAEEEPQDKSERPGFPALVKYTDTEEMVVVDTMDEINRGRPFVLM